MRQEGSSLQVASPPLGLWPRRRPEPLRRVNSLSGTRVRGAGLEERRLRRCWGQEPGSPGPDGPGSDSVIRRHPPPARGRARMSWDAREGRGRRSGGIGSVPAAGATAVTARARRPGGGPEHGEQDWLRARGKTAAGSRRAFGPTDEREDGGGAHTGWRVRACTRAGSRGPGGTWSTDSDGFDSFVCPRGFRKAIKPSLTSDAVTSPSTGGLRDTA